ncbi:hypothetical protein LTR37_003529 [Vermiconidia calcicola]|uniref:Uncharacterized protein n=1 Tax=Vermiconidia calcicola TaxID=1690605 RepID=A0ACC3NPN2_9PEZI|nr:hypothetical protein LTR37_003529 [Vermiconidia calcicola]
MARTYLDQRRNAIPTEPSNTMRTAAADAVFGTYELVEKIILALPPEDILLAAKVNKATFTVTEDSSAIRNRLYASRYLSLHNDQPVNTDSWFVFFDFSCATLLIRRLGEVEVICLIYTRAQSGLKIVAGRNRSISFEVIVGGAQRIQFRGLALQTIEVSSVHVARNTDVVGYLDRYRPPPKQLIEA